MTRMDAGNIAAIITSLFALFGVWASSRNARKATEKNAVVVSTTELEKSRFDASKDAYERARKMDIETIERQDSEIAEIRDQNHRLNDDMKILHADNTHLLADNEQLRIVNERLRRENQELFERLERLERRGITAAEPKTEPMREVRDGI
jgi:septal ring factor EnvC (AmiA/AmiB activator)